MEWRQILHFNSEELSKASVRRFKSIRAWLEMLEYMKQPKNIK